MECASLVNRLLAKDGAGVRNGDRVAHPPGRSRLPPVALQRRRKLRLRAYAVTCLNEDCAILEWVPNTRWVRSLNTGCTDHSLHVFVFTAAACVMKSRAATPLTAFRIR